MDIAPLSQETSGTPAKSSESIEPETFPSTFPYTWAMLLSRIYEALPLVCPKCGSAMRIIAFITNSTDVKRILTHIGEPSGPPPLSPSRAPPEEEFEFNQDLNQDGEFEFDQHVEDDDDTVM